MLTDYFVHCPYHDCGWRGSLFPLGDRKDMLPATFARREVSFCCKRCSRVWQARIVADCAVPVPLETEIPVTLAAGAEHGTMASPVGRGPIPNSDLRRNEDLPSRPLRLMSTEEENEEPNDTTRERPVVSSRREADGDSTSVAAGEMSPNVLTMVVRIDREFDNYTEQDQQAILNFVKDLLDTQLITIVDKQRGSVLLTLELPPDDAIRLLAAIQAGLLKKFDVVDARVVARTERSPRDVSVFLSSTAVDLSEYRQAAARVICDLGYRCVRMEDFGAADWSAEDCCSQKVEQCQLFFGIVGHLYGSSPKRKMRSYTEIEYRAATAAGIPRLMYVLPDHFPVPANMIESDEKRRRQKSFRNSIQAERVCDSTFVEPEEFSRRLIRALRAWEEENALVSPNSQSSEELKNYAPSCNNKL